MPAMVGARTFVVSSGARAALRATGRTSACRPTSHVSRPSRIPPVRPRCGESVRDACRNDADVAIASSNASAEGWRSVNAVALQLVLGGVLLYFGAEWFVAGASRLALALRIPEVVVGLTVVAYGTSAPEVVVALEAARAGHGDIAVGNVLGSNIANVGLILGATVFVRAASVDASLRRRELPVLVLSGLAVPVLLFDGRVERLEGIVLLAVAAAYSALMVIGARGPGAAVRAAAEAEAQAADVAGAPTAKSAPLAAATAAFGLGGILGGGHLFVEGAVGLATWLGMSGRMVGLTVVALGTSLPELVTSLVAARRGNSDIAMGNVVGSNIFNVLLCLGACAGTYGIRVDVRASGAELLGFLVATLVLAAFIVSSRPVRRPHGVTLLSAYAAFLVCLAVRG